MRRINALLLSIYLLLTVSCDDKAIVKIHNKEILKDRCMKLFIFPPNKDIENSFNRLYPFKESCSLDLFVSYKSNIVCNSNQNASSKVRGVPKGYLRLDVKDSHKPIYSYYLDVDELGNEEIKDGFSRLRADLEI